MAQPAARGSAPREAVPSPAHLSARTEQVSELPGGTQLEEHEASLGSRIRDARLARGSSLRQFAKELGVSASFISQLENGKTQPSVATLYSISSLLGMSIDELFTGTASVGDSPSPGDATDEPGLLPASDGDIPSLSRAEGRRASDAHDHKPLDLSLGPVVRPTERKSLKLNSGVVWERLSAVPGSDIDFMVVRYDVGGSSTADEMLMRHMGIEHGYIVSGTLDVVLGFETYRLRPGDSIAFDSTTPHRLVNAGDEPVEAVWFVHGRVAGPHSH